MTDLDPPVFRLIPLSDGRNVIHEREIVCGVAGPDFKRCVVNLNVPFAQQGDKVISEQVQVDFDCDGWAEAFAHFYEAMPGLIADIQKKARAKHVEPKLHVPGGRFSNNGG